MALLDDLPEDLKPLAEDEQNRTNLERLIMQVQSGVTPFVGAGLSFAFGFKLWGAFLASHLKASGGRLVSVTGKKPDWYVQIEDDLKNFRYEEAANQLYKRNDRGFNDAVTTAFGSLQRDRVAESAWSDPSHAMFYVPDLSDGPVITTNFDEALETVFKRNGQEFKDVVMGAQIAAVQRQTDVNGRFLLKLHGGYYADQNRVLTKEEYAKAYGAANAGEVNEKKPLPALLAKLLENRPFLFIGCSLYQDRTLVVAQRAAKYRGGTRHFALVEDMPLDDNYIDRTPELNAKEIAPIFYPAGQHDLVPELLAYLVKKRAEFLGKASLPTGTEAVAAKSSDAETKLGGGSDTTTPSPASASNMQSNTFTLSGQQSEQLQNALLSAFNSSTLEQMLSYRMDADLDRITEAGNLSDKVKDVIKWAKTNGRLKELIEKAHLYIPGNPELREFVQKLNGAR